MTPEREGLGDSRVESRSARVSDLSGTDLDGPQQETELAVKVEIRPMGEGRGGREGGGTMVLKESRSGRTVGVGLVGFRVEDLIGSVTLR
jgi:hypothetical protein